MDVGLEIKSEKPLKKKEKTMYIVFKSAEERNEVYDSIFKSLINPNDCITTERDIMEYTQQWS